MTLKELGPNTPEIRRTADTMPTAGNQVELKILNGFDQPVDDLQGRGRIDISIHLANRQQYPPFEFVDVRRFELFL